MSAVLESAPPETLADVVHRLGGISLDRIRWTPYPGTATLDDAISEKHCELIDGILVEKSMGHFESRIGQVLACYLELWLSTNRLGFVIGEGGMTRLDSGDMRIPDVYVVRWERVPGNEVPRDAVTKVIPHVAVEVLRRDNTEAEMTRKRHEFFRNGTEQFWVVRPRDRTVDVWTAVDNMTTLTIADTLSGGDALPGFALPVRELFEGAERGTIDVALARKMLNATSSDSPES